ncbi:transposase [Niabella sp. CJ426]|uniref:transposase n=1 Tax=Niabella sp. CJ426 TaxID=3393740 RepID=UPI003CFBCEC2
MSNTYTRIYIHVVFAVRYRRALIEQAWEDQLHKYITGIVQKVMSPALFRVYLLRF